MNVGNLYAFFANSRNFGVMLLISEVYTVYVQL